MWNWKIVPHLGVAVLQVKRRDVLVSIIWRHSRLLGNEQVKGSRELLLQLLSASLIIHHLLLLVAATVCFLDLCHPQVHDDDCWMSMAPEPGQHWSVCSVPSRISEQACSVSGRGRGFNWPWNLPSKQATEGPDPWPESPIYTCPIRWRCEQCENNGEQLKVILHGWRWW